jgi:hypothetical protein
MIQPKNKREPGHPNWGGAREESKLIKKYADQWCRDHGYPIKKRVIQRGRKYGQNVSEKRQ